MGYILNGGTYGWVEDDIIEVDIPTDIPLPIEQQVSDLKETAELHTEAIFDLAKEVYGD